MGSRRMNEVYPFMYSPAARPSSTRAPPAKNRKLSAITGISSLMTRENTLPTFWDSIRPNSSPCSSTRSASLRRARCRSDGVESNHVSSNAFRAAATARLTSSAAAAGTSAITSPVAGFWMGSVSPVDPSTHSPPMNICWCLTAVAMSNLPPSNPKLSTQGYAFPGIGGQSVNGQTERQKLYATANGNGTTGPAMRSGRRSWIPWGTTFQLRGHGGRPSQVGVAAAARCHEDRTVGQEDACRPAMARSSAAAGGARPDSFGRRRLGRPAVARPARRVQQVAGPKGQEELHPVAGRGQVAAGQLLDLAHPVAQRVPVHEQVGRGGLPPGVALEERPERRDQLAAVDSVVPVQRGQDAVGERRQR